MYNILIDGLPTEYEGYLINYQYYNGIIIDQCLKNKEGLFTVDDYGTREKIYTALTILFGNGIPEFKLALEGLEWFLSCGKSELRQSSCSDTTEYFNFDVDSDRIYSAFRLKYNINLATEKNLHWFEFIYLFNDLAKTAFREVVNIRMIKPSEYKNYSKEARAEIIKQKKKFALRNESSHRALTDEEAKAIENFEKLIGR